MTRAIVIAKKTGQVGNRLTVYAHWIGAALERGWTVVNPSFAEYARFFAGTAADPWGRFPGDGRRRAADDLRRACAYAAIRTLYEAAKVAAPVSAGRVAWVRAQKTLHYDIAPVLERCEADGTALLLAQGFHFRHHGWAARHAGAIRRHLTPLPEWTGPAEAAVVALRRDGAAVVGVHVRHGDYAHHLDGRWFYPHAVYAGLMGQVRDLLAPRPVRFLVCTNAPVPGGAFAGLDWAPGPGHLISDLHALSRCERILGPPSSFSAWAAFHGGARLHFIEDPARPLREEDFQPCPSPDPRY